MENYTSKSWMITMANPEDHGFVGSEQEICDQIVNKFIEGHQNWSIYVAYCISEKGFRHCHIACTTKTTTRLKQISKIFNTAHIEVLKGTRQEVLDYINKTGKFSDDTEKVIATSKFGLIEGRIKKNKKENTLDVIDKQINEGKTPTEIISQGIRFAKYKNQIDELFLIKKNNETEILRNLKVYYHVGKSGTSKTYSTVVELTKKYGEDNVYVANDFTKEGYSIWDNYQAEEYVVLDDLRNEIPFSKMLTILDKTKKTLYARYKNKKAVYKEIHITSVYPPEELYTSGIIIDKDRDEIEQLLRRIDYVIYHKKDSKGNYLKFCISARDYKDYDTLLKNAENYFMRGGKSYDDF